jgi:uncharacterized protein YbjT (DUF2867 family)
MKVLVAGASGYVGSRLVPLLLGAGHRVRVLVRAPDRLRDRPWADDVEGVVGDLVSSEGLDGLADGVDAAYYLVHSMGSGPDFPVLDRVAAERFGRSCRNVPKLIYLGGLLPPVASKHLRSRAEVGEILRSLAPTTELRAGPIIGAGSGSFEMVRYLTERLPLMVTPRWVENQVQPIGIDDVLRYLSASLALPPLGVVDVGADRLSFRNMMEQYAAVRGLERVILPVPVLAPRLAARWVGLVTPIPNRIAVPLIEGVVASVVADTRRARELFPEIQPVLYREAVRVALKGVQLGRPETRWTAPRRAWRKRVTRDWEGLMQDVRVSDVDAPAGRVFEVLRGLGGERGWLAWNLLWRARGLVDRLLGGPGFRLRRRHPDELHVGDSVDFWRVEQIDPPRLLRLRAEMRLPGRAWLRWEVRAAGHRSMVVQTATFAPTGLFGALYWYALHPIHGVVFDALVRAIRRHAEERHAAGGPSLTPRRLAP